MKELKEYIADIVTEFIDDPYISASEEAVDCIVLPDGRRAQVSIKIETNKNMWLPMKIDARPY